MNNEREEKKIIAPLVNLEEANILFRGQKVEYYGQELEILPHPRISSSGEHLYKKYCNSTKAIFQITASFPLNVRFVCADINKGDCYQTFNHDGEPQD